MHQEIAHITVIVVSIVTEGCVRGERIATRYYNKADATLMGYAGFHSTLEGFRITLLQTSDEVRRDTLKCIRDDIEAYVS